MERGIALEGEEKEYKARLTYLVPSIAFSIVPSHTCFLFCLPRSATVHSTLL
jgi:hypothetical protein